MVADLVILNPSNLSWWGVAVGSAAGDTDNNNNDSGGGLCVCVCVCVEGGGGLQI